MRNWLTAAILPILLALSAPARAAACDQLMEPLGESEVENLAIPVRDGFPAMYSGILDKVQIRVSDEPGYQTYYEQTPRGGEITVPSYMPKYICMLVAISLIADGTPEVPMGAEQWARMNAMQNPCPSGEVNSDCMLPMFERLYEIMRPQLDSMPPATTALLQFMSREAVKSSLAHEFGHVIIERGYAEERRLAITDNELEADMLALLPMVGQRLPPMADTFMFASILLVERINRRSNIETGVHELTACRVLRQQKIRQAILPHLNALAKWRPGSAPPVPEAISNTFNPNLVEMQSCAADLPAEITALRHELDQLHAALAALSEGPITVEALNRLDSLNPDTLLGSTAKSLITLRAAQSIVFPIVDPADLLSTRQAALAQAKARGEALRLVNTFDLPSYRARDYWYEIAAVEFFQQPEGSSLLASAQEVVARMYQADEGVAASVESLDVRATMEVLAGDCAAAADSAGYAAFLHQEELANIGPFAAQVGYTIAPFPPNLQALADHQASIVRGEAELDPAICEAIRQPAASAIKQRTGWVD